LSDNPFWFLDDELLTALLADEFRFMAELFVKYPKLREFFDLPEATPEQRSACFTLLAHRRLIEEIQEKFLGMQQQPPLSAEEEKKVIPLMQNLFADDAPAWVLEANQAAELLPSRVYEQLPEPLRRGGGFYANDPVQTELIATAARELSSVEKIRALSGMVIDQQLKRLEGRWPVARPVENVVREIIVLGQESKKRKVPRKRDRQLIARDKLIAEIADISPTPHEFLKLMDERKVKPQPAWNWPGSWREAYKDEHLRELIQKDKSRALVRVRERVGK
jgi:hypothetical protein